MRRIVETGMVLCCGAASALYSYQSLKSRTAAGRSILFQWAIIIGYICGIIHKILYSNNIVLYLYILNLLMVSFDTLLYFRNKKLDQQRAQKTA